MIALLAAWWRPIAAVLVVIGLMILGSCTITRCTGEQRALQAERARTGGIMAEGSEKASQAATEAVAGLGEREADRTEINQENRDAILSAPDAKSDAGAAGAAGLDGVCRRPSYRDTPRCVRLLGPRPASTPR